MFPNSDIVVVDFTVCLCFEVASGFFPPNKEKLERNDLPPVVLLEEFVDAFVESDDNVDALVLLPLL